MENINIVIPLSGLGSRFSKEGYTVPKPLIKVVDRYMIELVIDNLRVKSYKAQYIFIVQKQHIELFELDKIIKNKLPDAHLIIIDYLTEGQLSSVLLAKEFIQENPLLIANCDQYVDTNIDDFLIYAQTENLDGLIMTIFDTSEKWSYVRKENGFVVETREKEVISDEATVGIYYFKSGKGFVQSAENMVKKGQRVNNEFYVCPVYNEYLKQNKKVGTLNIGTLNNGMYSLGTPEDLELFLQNQYIIKKIFGSSLWK